MKISRVLVAAALLAGVVGCESSPEGSDSPEVDTTDGSTSDASTSGSSSASDPVVSTGQDSSGEVSTSASTSSTSGAETSASSGGGSDETSGTGDEELIGCYDYDAFEPISVGFRSDVMPIFAARCAGCHADPNASIYFGMGGTTDPEASATYTKLLDGTPKQAPHLSFVVPFDPVRSYMLAKVEYDDPGGTCSVVVCSEPGCNLQAPPSAQLPEEELAVLRSWVINGALDD